MTDPRPGPIEVDSAEFAAAFGVGRTRDAIHPVDGAGVVLAAVQALNRGAEQRAARLDALKAAVDRIEDQRR